MRDRPCPSPCLPHLCRSESACWSGSGHTPRSCAGWNRLSAHGSVPLQVLWVVLLGNAQAAFTLGIQLRCLRALLQPLRGGRRGVEVAGVGRDEAGVELADNGEALWAAAPLSRRCSGACRSHGRRGHADKRNNILRLAVREDDVGDAAAGAGTGAPEGEASARRLARLL